MRQYLRAAVASTAALAAPASAADHGHLGGAHWNFHRAAAVQSAVLIVDTTGDWRVHRALREFTVRWNAMRKEAAFAPSPPPPVQLTMRAASHGCATPRFVEVMNRGAEVIVCRDDSIGSSGVGGPYWVDAEGHTHLGIVKLRGRTLAWSTCNLRTAIAHEMGHVMGLEHNEVDAPASGPSVMMSGQGPYNRGCPTWFNAQDKEALLALYAGHALQQTSLE